MNKFLKLAQGIDVSALNEQLRANPDLWGQYSARKDVPAHSEMSDIWVRYNHIDKLKDGLAAFNNEHVPVWYPAWDRLPALKSIVFALMAAVEGEMLGGVLITRIPHGCGIGPHTDRGWHVEYYDKFYLSLESAPGAEFWCGDEMINPARGDLYRFDNRTEHWVTNNSGQDRITLIVCIRTDKFKGQQ